LLRRADRSRTRRSFLRPRSFERRRPRRAVDQANEYVFLKEWAVDSGRWEVSPTLHSPLPTPHSYEHRHYSVPYVRRQRDRRLRAGPRIVRTRPQCPFHQLRVADEVVQAEREVAIPSG